MRLLPRKKPLILHQANPIAFVSNNAFLRELRNKFPLFLLEIPSKQELV